MKTPRSDHRWEQLVRTARADSAPPVDVPALLRAVRQAPVPPRSGWAEEFAALFGSGRLIAACLAGVGVCVLLTGWQAWECWRVVPWAQLLIETGGVR